MTTKEELYMACARIKTFAFVPIASTPEMRNRLRELATPPRDDFDRAVLIVLDDFDRLYAQRGQQ